MAGSALQPRLTSSEETMQSRPSRPQETSLMPYPTPAGSVSELMAALDGIASIADDRLVIDDERRFRDEGIRSAVWSATFSTDADVVQAARWIVWEASQALGARSASI